jgi:hypothetical protein
MDIDEKRAAAIAAVMQYIQSEEELAVVQSRALSAGAPAAGPPAPAKLWGVSGRQAMMQMRNLMQLKSFHGVRFR